MSRRVTFCYSYHIFSRSCLLLISSCWWSLVGLESADRIHYPFIIYIYIPVYIYILCKFDCIFLCMFMLYGFNMIFIVNISLCLLPFWLRTCQMASGPCFLMGWNVASCWLCRQPSTIAQVPDSIERMARWCTMQCLIWDTRGHHCYSGCSRWCIDEQVESILNVCFD